MAQTRQGETAPEGRLLVVSPAAGRGEAAERWLLLRLRANGAGSIEVREGGKNAEWLEDMGSQAADRTVAVAVYRMAARAAWRLADVEAMARALEAPAAALRGVLGDEHRDEEAVGAAAGDVDDVVRSHAGAAGLEAWSGDGTDNGNGWVWDHAGRPGPPAEPARPEAPRAGRTPILGRTWLVWAMLGIFTAWGIGKALDMPMRVGPAASQTDLRAQANMDAAASGRWRVKRSPQWYGAGCAARNLSLLAIVEGLGEEEVWTQDGPAVEPGAERYGLDHERGRGVGEVVVADGNVWVRMGERWHEHPGSPAGCRASGPQRRGAGAGSTQGG